MIPWEILGRERAPDGAELTLSHRNGEFVIRAGGRELMSSRGSHSEEEMARIACKRLGQRRENENGSLDGTRHLIGGLGMGYTTRAALDALPVSSSLVVAEIVPAVIAWNRGPLAHLAGRPLDDPRVRVESGDVATVIRTTTKRFDAILLDVDNGPQGLTRMANNLLYGDLGLAAIKRALTRGGILAVWSASPDAAFEQRMRKAGYETDTACVPARGSAGGPMHTIFFGAV